VRASCNSSADQEMIDIARGFCGPPNDRACCVLACRRGVNPLTYRPDVAHRRNLGNHVIRAIRSAVPLHPLPDTLPSLTKCPRLAKRRRGHCPKGQFHNSKIAGKILTATIRFLVSRFLLRRWQWRRSGAARVSSRFWLPMLNPRTGS
jgi:hypothetical protein